MNLRQFTTAGIEVFRRFLAECRKSPEIVVPSEMLTESTLTEEIVPRITVQPRQFHDKRDAAEYLRDLLYPLNSEGVSKNAGLWSWLSCFHFDAVCPAKDGQRSVKNDYSYVFEPTSPRHYYRHLMYVPWYVQRLAPEENRLFLTGQLNVLDKATSEVLKRLFLTRIPCIFEVLDTLYWDQKRGRIRAGMVSPGRVRPGDLVHRLPVRIRQLEMTYDLQSLSAEQLIELLGEEFQTLSKSQG
jgi:hypothetical protein